MRIVFREWLKCKSALAELITSYILLAIEFIINAQVLLWISEAVNNPSDLQFNLIRLGITLLIQTAIGALSDYLRQVSMHKCTTVLGNQWADKVLDSDVQMFHKYSTSYLQTYGEKMWDISTALITMFRIIINAVSVIINIIYIGRLASVVVLPIIVIYMIGAVVIKQLLKTYHRIDRANDGLKRDRNQELENAINGFEEIRTFNMTEKTRKKIRGITSQIFENFKKRSMVNGAMSIAYYTIDAIGLIVIILYTSDMVVRGVMMPATAVALAMYVFRILDPLTSIIEHADTLSTKLASVDKYDEIISYKNEKRPDETIVLSSFNDAIRINNVSFSYNETANTINNLNMTIYKGQKIGICGASGGGKSTLLKLLNRFYQPKSGAITIDGVPINQIENNSYRKFIGTVQQDVTIFPGTIWENITYGSENFTEADVIEAAKNAKIYDFIQSLDAKFQTQVGNRGLKLSGGQKQRIALARLFLKNPEIILLDEATSALDNECESGIQEAIENMTGKTVVAIAHRLSTIKNFDMIYVVGKDGVIESGTHDQLMKHQSVYYQMATRNKQ